MLPQFKWERYKYLTAFGEACDLNHVDPVDRLHCLTPFLDPKATQTYSQMGRVVGGRGYRQFKKALLLKSELTSQASRERFWGVQKSQCVTCMEATTLLGEHLHKWGKGAGVTV